MPRPIKERKYNTKPNSTSFKKGHEGLVGKENPMWKGNNAGYGAIHDWVKQWLGKPKKCEMCGTTTAKKFEWASKSRENIRKLDEWMRLCTSCHHKYDECRKKMWLTRRKKHE